MENRKKINTIQNRGTNVIGPQPLNSSIDYCQKVLAQVTKVKEAIFIESRRIFRAPEHLVRLALNEAEVAAWQTQFPHLVFPMLATEKIQAVASWNARQQAVLRASSTFALGV